MINSRNRNRAGRDSIQTHIILTVNQDQLRFCKHLSHRLQRPFITWITKVIQ